VPDVGRALDSQPAAVDRDLARNQRDKVTHAACGGVIKAESHSY
jgi:hypothetical protein